MVKKRHFLLQFPGKCVIITVISTGLAAARLIFHLQKLRPMKSTLSTGMRSIPYDRLSFFAIEIATPVGIPGPHRQGVRETLRQERAGPGLLVE